MQRLMRGAFSHKALLLIAAFVLIPGVLAPGVGLLSLIAQAFGGFSLTPTQSFAARETGLLMLGVAVFAGSLGVGTAWLVSLYAFPLRRVLEVGLLLPLAFPTYLAAYVAVDLFGYFGPVQSLWRALGGTGRFFEFRSLTGAVLVLGLVLFPYVYVPCRLVFGRTGRSMIDAARLLGTSGVRLFIRIGLPVARPALIGGVVLALLETLNDIGASEHLGISSLSVVIRDLWLNRGDPGGAARIAGVLAVITMLLLLLDPENRRASGGRGQAKAGARAALIPLSGLKAGLALALCALPVLLGFLLPALFLLSRAVLYAGQQADWPALAHATLTSLLLASGVSVMVMLAGALLAMAMRGLPGLGAARVLANLGYALPGTVLVLAILPVLRWSEHGLGAFGVVILFSGSAIGLVYALGVRFFGIGTAQAALALGRLPANVDAIARLHGMGDIRLALKVHWPVMRPGLLLGGALVFIDTIKELPATLLLRPLNFETLATRAYAEAGAGLFEHAAVESLLILLISGMASVLLSRKT